MALDGRAAGFRATASAVPGLSPVSIRISTLSSLGIQDFQAATTPNDKHENVKTLKAAGRIGGVAGDGISDAGASR